MKDDVRLIPIDKIRILNPRQRDRKKFEVIVQSIRKLGLKKPVQVSLRTKDEKNGPRYDLVCGQGRIEAFTALGHKEIPAIVVEVSKEERLVRSLVENIARRNPVHLDLVHEIERLKALGYTNTEVGKKLDVNESTIRGLISLKDAHEVRLLDAAISGKVPLWVAIEIARTDSVETQRELLKAYERKLPEGITLRMLKRLIDQRRYFGRDHEGVRRKGRNTGKTGNTAASLVNAFRREGKRQKLQIRKARLSEAKLMFLVTAFAKLFRDEHFATLLRAESLTSVPKYLQLKITEKCKEGT